MTANKQHASGSEHATQGQAPSITPPGLPQWLGDWYFAWSWRRKMRRLLALENLGQVRLGSARERVRAGAQMPLRMVVARQAEWRRAGR